MQEFKLIESAESDQMSKKQLSKVLFLAKAMAKKYGGRGRIGVLDADDIAQEAVVRVLKKLDTETIGPGYIYSAVRSAAMDAFKKGSKDRNCLRFDSLDNRLFGSVCEKAGKSYLEEEASCKEQYLQLQLVLGKLSLEHRRALVLWLEGYSYGQIAEIAGTKVGTVRSRIHHGRKRASELLKACS